MDIREYYAIPGEKPLDRMPADGGLAGIFRTVGCIGDSLASGEFESMNEAGDRGYHDMFEYSWGQYFGRLVGTKVLNFSRGGMSAKEYCESFAEANHYWDEDKLCQCYVMALGVNDILNMHMPVGAVSDINLEDYEKNADTFAGWYARIIQRIRKMQPKARFFFMTMMRDTDEERNAKVAEHAALLHELTKVFEFSYVLDFFAYGPTYDAEFKRNFYLGGHLNSAGYLLTSRMLASYMDYIIRNNPEDFSQVGFIGTPVHNCRAKW